VIDARALLATHYAIAVDSPPETVADDVIRVGGFAIKHLADVAAIEHEAAILAALGTPDPRYRVQSLVPTRDGARFVELAGEAALVTAWRDGMKKVYTEIVAAEWHALGSQLAALHARLDELAEPLPRASERVFDLGAERRAIEDHPRRRELAGYFDARLALLDRFGERGAKPPPGDERAIHNDYNQHNYLFDGELPPIILDWEGAIAALREYEVVRCLNHLPLVAPAHATAFVDGYRGVRPLERDALRWAVDRSLLEHAVKSWPLDRPSGRALAGSTEVLHALHDGVGALERFFGVEDR
jgi:Ser/Thr protein kinase RdoA (MazF antagonist)